MSPTSYQAAPPRGNILADAGHAVKSAQSSDFVVASVAMPRLPAFPDFSLQNCEPFPTADQDFGRDCMAMATKAPIKIAGKSRPTEDSAMVSERAIGLTGLMSLPKVVIVAKL